MYAKNLEHLLVQCCSQCDISPASFEDMAARFEALRGSGRLPRGRANRSRQLNAGEIAEAVLGLVTQAPKWAGFAAIILGDLRPVGGVGASYHASPSLKGAIQLLLTDSNARKNLIALHLSVSERFNNSNGFGQLIYAVDGENRRRTCFVSKMALSLLGPGAERGFDADRSHAALSKSTILDREFFERIAAAVARSAALHESPIGDGSEYDAEEIKQAREAALGVRASSRFLNVGVDTQAVWPKEEMLIEFDKFKLVLMPKTKENMRSIHVDLHAHRLSEGQALTVINRFLSVLAWCEDQFAVIRGGGGSGSPVPIAVSKYDLAFVTAHVWPFSRSISDNDEVRRALATYREGLNALEMGSVSNAVLCFMKVIEVRHATTKKYMKWIASNFCAATASARQDILMESFLRSCGNERIEKYIHKSCRVAVAHASVESPSDGDDWAEVDRLRAASYILRLMARYLIIQELGVSEKIYADT